jgi:hypothetical protein
MYSNTMRVKIAMTEALRGHVAHYAEKNDMSMPQAYREIIEIGLFTSDVDLETFRPSSDARERISNVEEQHQGNN